MKKRLDMIIFDRGLTRSRRVARDLIKQGSVKVNGEIIKKQGKLLQESVKIDLLATPTYVSRGGNKLEHALNEFKIDVQNKTAIDVGASTGGFTDCLLKKGAKKVYSIDVGNNQLSHSLKSDNRVVSIENTDIRSLTKLPEIVDIAVIDVSFISLNLIFPAIKKFLKNKSDVIALIKPQFELQKNLKKKGVVNSEEMRNLARKKVVNFLKDNWTIKGSTLSPIKGASGNLEFLIHVSPR